MPQPLPKPDLEPAACRTSLVPTEAGAVGNSATVTTSSRLGEVALYFIRLGFTGFGGPAAHIAMMEQDLVQRRGWLDRRHFLDLLAAVSCIPGPTSTELVIQLGYHRAGRRGLVLAGICFIVPAMLIILPLAWLYVTYQQTPSADRLLRGLSASVVAIVAVALVRFARTGLGDLFTGAIAALAFAAALAMPHLAAISTRAPIACRPILAAAALAPDLSILAIAAGAGAVRAAWRVRRVARAHRPAVPMLLWPLLGTAVAAPIAVPATLGTGLFLLALLMLKIGATIFGSGYVLISYFQTSFVDYRHWLTQRQLLDAIAIGQVTPGPLLTAATFVGYVIGAGPFGGGTAGGLAGGIIATAAIFAPSFFFIAVLAPALPKIRDNPIARGALDATTAAVVALIAVTTLALSQTALANWHMCVLAAASALVLVVWNVNAALVLLAAALLTLGLGW